MYTKDIQQSVRETASFIVERWREASRLHFLDHYKQQVIEELLFFQNGKSQLPSDFFNCLFFSMEPRDYDLQYSFCELIKEYVETFQTASIPLFEPYEQFYSLFNALRKQTYVSDNLKEKLLVMHLWQLYKHRQYRLILKVLYIVQKIIKNEEPKNTIHYIKCLVLKNMFRYEELQLELSREVEVKQVTQPIQLLRRAHFAYFFGDFKKSVELYVESTKQRTNAYAAVFGLYALKMLKNTSFRSGALAKIFENVQLGDLGEQIQSWVDVENISIDLNQPENLFRELDSIGQMALFKHRQGKWEREQRKSWGFDSYLDEAYILFTDYLYESEFWGLPDRSITRSKFAEAMLSQILEEGKQAVFIKYVGYGISPKNVISDDKWVDNFRENPKELSQLLKAALHSFKIVQETERQDSPDLQPLYIADAVLKMMVSQIDAWPISFYKPLIMQIFHIMELWIPSANNSIHGTCHQLIVSYIRLSPPEEGVPLLERYLRYLANHLNDPYEQLAHLSLSWESNDISDFDETIWIGLFQNMLEYLPIRPEHYLLTAMQLDKIHPFASETIQKIIDVSKALRIENNTNEALLRLLLQFHQREPLSDTDWIKQRLDDITLLFLENKDISSNLGQPLYLLAEGIPLLEQNTVVSLLMKIDESIKKLEKRIRSDDFLGTGIINNYKEAVLYFLLHLSIFRSGTSVYLKYALSRMSEFFSILPHHDVQTLRTIMEEKQTDFHAFSKEIRKIWGEINRKERGKLLSFLRKWLRSATRLYPDEYALIEEITSEWNTLEENEKALVIALLADLSRIPEFLEKFSISYMIRPIVEFGLKAKEEMLVSIAYFIKQYNDSLGLEGDYNQPLQQLINRLNKSKHPHVKREWVNH